MIENNKKDRYRTQALDVGPETTDRRPDGYTAIPHLPFVKENSHATSFT